MTDQPAVSADWFKGQIAQYRELIRSIDEKRRSTGDVERDGSLTDQTPELRATCERIIDGLQEALRIVESDRS